MKEATRKEIKESISELENLGAKRDPLIEQVIAKLEKALILDKEKEDNGTGTKN